MSETARRRIEIASGGDGLVGGLLLALLVVGLFLPRPALAQNPLLDALETDPAEAEASAEGDSGARAPIEEIEYELAAARARLESLQPPPPEDGAEPPEPSLAAESAARLVRILERRRETQDQIDTLEAGRTAIESGLALEPAEIIGDPPPFPVPTLDGVLSRWREDQRQEEQSRAVLVDRRANLALERQAFDDVDRERRRVRDLLQRETNDVERVRLETQVRRLEDQCEIVRQQVLLAEQRVATATIEHDLHVSATRQARATLVWVESQLAPRDSDLSDAIGALDRERLDLDLALDQAESRLADAEATLVSTEDRRSRIKPEEEARFALELATRRAQLAHRQQIVTLLSDRTERLGRMRTAWQQRYAVLGEGFDLMQAPSSRSAAELEVERLTNLRRIHENERAEAQLAQADLLRRLSEASGTNKRLLELELEDLDELSRVYDADLASLDEALLLEDRLLVEFAMRLDRRDLGERAQSALESARSFWSYELTTSEDSPITPGKLLIALAIFVFGLWIARLAQRLLSRRFFPRLGFDTGASSAFASLVFYGLLAGVILLALRAVNIPLTAFAVAGGALAIGVGFGSQTLISNFISGLLLLAERPIRTGDLVEVGGLVGTVDSIGLRSTRIQTPDNFHIIVPNAAFLESNVVNWTHEDPMLRLRVKVGVAYGSPVRKVEELLLEAAKEHPRCRSHPEPTVLFADFGDSALLFEIRFWIRYDERTDRAALQSDVRFRIDEIFAEHGIVIAFPQMDVHVDMSPVPAPPDPAAS